MSPLRHRHPIYPRIRTNVYFYVVLAPLHLAPGARTLTETADASPITCVVNRSRSTLIKHSPLQVRFKFKVLLCLPVAMSGGASHQSGYERKYHNDDVCSHSFVFPPLFSCFLNQSRDVFAGGGGVGRNLECCVSLYTQRVVAKYG